MTTMPPQRPHRSKQTYSTPADFIASAKALLGISAFAFDFAASASNAKATRYWSKRHDALSFSAEEWAAQVPTQLDWGWLNPEFTDIRPWAARCAQVRELGRNIAFLVPASVGANWFRDHVAGQAHVKFLNGRLAFIENQPDALYPKDCILALYSPRWQPAYVVWEWRTEVARQRSGESATLEV